MSGRFNLLKSMLFYNCAQCKKYTFKPWRVRMTEYVIERLNAMRGFTVFKPFCGARIERYRMGGVLLSLEEYEV